MLFLHMISTGWTTKKGILIDMAITPLKSTVLENLLICCRIGTKPNLSELVDKWLRKMKLKPPLKIYCIRFVPFLYQF